MRRHFHIAGLREGRLICQNCGVEIDQYFTADVPCTKPTTPEDVVQRLFRIFVYNCQAHLVAEIPRSFATVEVVGLEPSEDIESELEERITRDVEEQGSLTWSGYYALSPENEHRIAEWLRERKLRLDY